MSPNSAALTPPTRSAVERGRSEYLLKGSWSKADVYVAAVAGGVLVVKDFAAKSPIVRWLGRIQISRECAAYAAVDGVGGVARWLGRIDAHALALERLEATPVRQIRKSVRPDDLLEQIRSTLDAIHERGVVHNDLRGQDNTLVRPDGRVVLIDFAGALCFRPGSFWHRLMFRRLSKVDEAAYLKWKEALRPGALTPEEQRFLRKFARFRRLWIFNPKGALKQS